ncbi:MAG: RluA family pseudouridine synthase [Deltaproteobacteria bacterium]|nr:RluA family pseudouridine synthase [Deltaproteobacteria bacterium]
MESARQTFVVRGAEETAERLDIFLADKLAPMTRSSVKNLITNGRVLVNGRRGRAGSRTREGDCVEVTLPSAPASCLSPEDKPLDILYEDSDIIVINKPSGLAVHPGAGRPSGTLVNALLAHTKELSNIGAPLRPGIVHRLDMDTTGVIAVAKNDQSYLSLTGQFKDHGVVKRYLALVWGAVKKDEGVIDMALGRDIAHRKKISVRAGRKRRAITRYRVLKRYPGLTLVLLTPETGRTHQLRAHLSEMNHPIVGDQLYGKGRQPSPSVLPKRAVDGIKMIKRQLLHAAALGIRHPSTGVYTEFTSPLPPDMESVLRILDEECLKKDTA